MQCFDPEDRAEGVAAGPVIVFGCDRCVQAKGLHDGDKAISFPCGAILYVDVICRQND
jgi:hypothetical protein